MGRRPDPKITEYVAKDGTATYRVRVRVGGRQTTETFTSRAAAESFVRQVKDPQVGPERAVVNRDRADPHSSAYVPTLAEMLTRHIAALTGVEQRTRVDYQSIAERTWLPILGRLRVDDVSRDDVARWVNHQDGKSAPKTIKNAHAVLSAVLTSAERDGYIVRNPAKGTKLPRTGEQDATENRYLTYEEFADLFDATAPWYQPMVMTLFGTGMRYSEAAALQVRDFEPRSGHLRIQRAWKKDPDGYRVGAPKSRKSRRTIPLPPETVEAITPLLDRPGDAFLFTTVGGSWVRLSNFYNRVWVPACTAAGLSPRPRVHDARHTHASWLIAQGVRLEVVQERLGHEDFAITRRVYGHLLPELQFEAAEAASRAFAATRLRAAGGGTRALPGASSPGEP